MKEYHVFRPIYTHNAMNPEGHVAGMDRVKQFGVTAKSPAEAIRIARQKGFIAPIVAPAPVQVRR